MCKHCTVRLVDYYWITKVGTRTVRRHYCLDDPSTDLRAGSAAAGGKNYRRFAESNLSQLEIVLAGRTLEGHAVANHGGTQHPVDAGDKATGFVHQLAR